MSDPTKQCDCDAEVRLKFSTPYPIPKRGSVATCMLRSLQAFWRSPVDTLVTG